MCIDLVICLSDESELTFHVSKLELMKEGLFQIRDVLIDTSRYQERLVQRSTVVDVELGVCGGVHVVGIGQKLCLYAGKILTVDEEEVVRSGVKQLDAAMGLFKFVWESAGVKGDLEVEGHLWCVGAQNRSFIYRGNVYMVHAINL
ncbi:uncharacterized protein LOC131024775 [Salvia miltiorrhiza]|uniref:uncharacterized protein LOC131024775 n=1 Tax=Salvia miltiorrhiza TaxID=226208 RepID=UPI0025ABED51|nr:uncharacterized protein LOC131024775 [Salvia miltiorrhiza]